MLHAVMCQARQSPLRLLPRWMKMTTTYPCARRHPPLHEQERRPTRSERLPFSTTPHHREVGSAKAPRSIRMKWGPAVGPSLSRIRRKSHGTSQVTLNSSGQIRDSVSIDSMRNGRNALLPHGPRHIDVFRKVGSFIEYNVTLSKLVPEIDTNIAIFRSSTDDLSSIWSPRRNGPIPRIKREE